MYWMLQDTFVPSRVMCNLNVSRLVESQHENRPAAEVNLSPADVSYPLMPQQVPRFLVPSQSVQLHPCQSSLAPPMKGSHPI